MGNVVVEALPLRKPRRAMNQAAPREGLKWSRKSYYSWGWLGFKCLSFLYYSLLVLGI